MPSIINFTVHNIVVDWVYSTPTMTMPWKFDSYYLIILNHIYLVSYLMGSNLVIEIPYEPYLQYYDQVKSFNLNPKLRQ